MSTVTAYCTLYTHRYTVLLREKNRNAAFFNVMAKFVSSLHMGNIASTFNLYYILQKKMFGHFANLYVKYNLH